MVVVEVGGVYVVVPGGVQVALSGLLSKRQRPAEQMCEVLEQSALEEQTSLQPTVLQVVLLGLDDKRQAPLEQMKLLFDD